ncbi:hypothetical protein [Streptomyces buecherae]|uniref:hypothetical protein n=1 Tax=Streptomyces buecherae TaxID=2763006 RepID=UPI0037BD9802
MRDTTNPELTAAWASVPDVAVAEQRHAAVVALRKEFRAGMSPVAARDAVIESVITEFQATGNWPTDIGKRATKAHVDALEWETEALALSAAEYRTQYAKEDVRDTLSGDALTHLGRRLADILAEAKTLAVALGGVSTAEAAIHAGGDALDAWRRLTALVGDLTNVRAAQWAVLQSVSGQDDGSRMRNWRRDGHGHVVGFRPDDVPSHVLDALRADRYTVPSLVWLANIGTAYVPGSFADLEDEVTASTEPLTYDDAGPIRDLSPIELPALQARPAEVYAHSRAAQLDFTAPASRRPTPNAVVADEKPVIY